MCLYGIGRFLSAFLSYRLPRGKQLQLANLHFTATYQIRSAEVGTQ